MSMDYSNLYARMKQSKITQRELAQILGITESTLSLRMNGKSEFTQAEINTLCKTLSIPESSIGAYFFREQV